MRVLAIIFIILTLLSCEDEAVVSEIKGTIYRNCNFEPLPYSEIALKVNSGQSFSEPLIIAGDQADANGYFKFNYELNESEKGTADLILVQPTGFTTLASNLTLNEDYTLDLINENIASLVINLSGSRNFTSTDTLYMTLSTSSEDYHVIQPTNGIIDTIFALAENPVETKTTAKFMFGYGLKDFERSKAAFAADTFWRHRDIPLSGCNQIDTLNLELN